MKLFAKRKGFFSAKLKLFSIISLHCSRRQSYCQVITGAVICKKRRIIFNEILDELFANISFGLPQLGFIIKNINRMLIIIK